MLSTEADLRFTNSIQRRLSLLFVALFLLVTGSVGATYWGIQAQREDALVINLAGRQRMLTQKMIWLALSRPDDPELASTIQLFDQTLGALRNGGTVQYPSNLPSTATEEKRTIALPPAPDAQLRAELDQVAGLWEIFRSHLEPVNTASLQAESPIILAKLDSVVSQYEARTRAKLARVQIIQAVSLAAGLALLSWGYLLARRRIFRPLVDLRSAARHMSQGQLSQPVPPLGQDELGEVGQAFESMRIEVATAQDSLEGRVAQRTRELISAFEFSQEIVAQLDLSHLLQSVVDRTRALTGAEAAALCLLEPDPSALVLVAGSSNSQEIGEMTQPVENDPAYRVIKAGETVVVKADCTRCQFLLSHAPGICAVAPLRSGEMTLGALCVVRPHAQVFDPDETRALTLLANTATVAITNARLIEVGRRQAERAAILSERERLAAELHDNLAQTLGFINLKIDQMRLMINAGKLQDYLSDLAAVKSAISGAYGQVRASLVGLNEPLPAPGEFLQKLAASVDEISKVTDLEIHFEAAGAESLSISRLAQSQTLHIVREALTNINRHARARNSWVRVAADHDQAVIIIEDDGAGFDPTVVVGRDHLGLRLMQERAQRSGGTLMVESTPGEGTRVKVCYPLED